MESQMQTILVPTDFTPVTDNAIAHAVKFSKLLNKGITLLHIIKKGSEFKEADENILAQADSIFSQFQIRPHTIVQEGSIFTTIGEISNMIGAELIIMGTHGIHGMQKITGSWALKVTVTTKAPVIVVQEPPKRDTIKRIVFPVDFKKENKQKIGWACFIARLYGSKILVFKSNFRDKGYLRAIFTNMFFTEKYFKNKEIDYEVVTAEAKKNFTDQTIEFGERIRRGRQATGCCRR